MNGETEGALAVSDVADESLSEIEWCGRRGWLLRSDAIEVVIVPELGGRIASIFDRAAGREWLTQPIRATVGGGASYADSGPTGWDEMFPTIDACDYPVPGTFLGKALPDHGEVWNRPWVVEHVDGSTPVVRLSTDGTILPYRLSRSARLNGSHTLRLDYEVRNTGDAAFAYLWAAHPLLDVRDGFVLRLPASVRELVGSRDGRVHGIVGSSCEPGPGDGGAHDAWRDWRLPLGGEPAEKLFVPPDVHIDQVEVRASDGSSCLLQYDAEAIPFLGLWSDRRAPGTAVFAPEPMTGYFDSVERAWQHGSCAGLEPGERRSWWVEVQVGRSA